jgi:hypothetical protein
MSRGGNESLPPSLGDSRIGGRYHGIFTVASVAGVAHGCAGLRLVDNQTGEVKRVYVRPTARRNQLGTLLIVEIETYAQARGLSSLRLDSRHELHEARAMYTQQGYRDTPRFNHSTLAEIMAREETRAETHVNGRRSPPPPIQYRRVIRAPSARPKYEGLMPKDRPRWRGSRQDSDVVVAKGRCREAPGSSSR